MYLADLARSAAIFAVFLGLSSWRVFAVGSVELPKDVDRMLGWCTTISSVWFVVEVFKLGT
ncbi:MAG TPA: hypothetical protein VN088_05620 [Nocardioides sp.]|nr:hypothetical protein [Nocardioides sp.]